LKSEVERARQFDQSRNLHIHLSVFDPGDLRLSQTRAGAEVALTAALGQTCLTDPFRERSQTYRFDFLFCTVQSI